MKAPTDIAGEDGFSLPELLVAISLTVLVAALGMGLLTVSLSAEPKVRERAGDIQEARTMIERIGRELRQAQTVATASAGQLAFVTYVRASNCSTTTGGSTSILCRVTYTCASSCTRTVANPDGTGAAPVETLVEGLTGDPAFTYQSAYASVPCPGAASSTNPAYVCIEISFPGEDGEEAVTLSDGIGLRNWYEP
jgi:prepilin-type N-terminal cleavage/methylation domain-containing protein